MELIASLKEKDKEKVKYYNSKSLDRFGIGNRFEKIEELDYQHTLTTHLYKSILML